MHFKNAKGFTLLEALIVMVIFAAVVAIAVPNLLNMGKAAQLRSSARQLKNQMAKARVQAIENNSNMLVVFDTFVDGKISGYQIVEDLDGDCEIDGGENSQHIAINTVAITANNLTANAAGNLIVQWDTRGFPRKKDGTFTNGTITYSSSEGDLDVILSRTGNMRIE